MQNYRFLHMKILILVLFIGSETSFDYLWFVFVRFNVEQGTIHQLKAFLVLHGLGIDLRVQFAFQNPCIPLKVLGKITSF